MKLTLSWLRDHLDYDADVEVLAHTLTSIGLEVEAIIDPRETLSGFEVAEIIETRPHPDADRLQICVVKTGDGTQELVCGAANARAGIKGILAKEGATIPATKQVLRQAKIRGVVSNGMMCAAEELELKSVSDGIIELPDTATIGQAAADALGLTDAVIEIGLTPNRPDCLGVRGIARDLAAAGFGTLKPQTIPPIKTGKVGRTINVSSTTDICPIFWGCMIEGVANCQSPDWLRQRLLAIGAKPINALVDVTNYLSFDRGQPLHVYDADKLNGDLVARVAQAGDKFCALDEEVYELRADDCVIADDKNTLGLAGIMGGADSGSSLDTKNVFVECAWFAPEAIAKSGRHHRLESDARYRYERGVDRGAQEDVLKLAVQMITDICGGTAGAAVSCVKESATLSIAFDPAYIVQLTNVDMPEAAMEKILTALGFGIEKAKKIWQISVPTWRPDVTQAVDLVEEIIRIYGLDNVSSVPLLPRNNVSNRTALAPAQQAIMRGRRALAGRGMVEAMSWSFINRAHAELFAPDGAEPDNLEIANPISSELSHMRPSLLPGLLSAVARNYGRGHRNLALFETGYQFHSDMTQSLVIAGVRAGAYNEKHWRNNRDNDIYDIRNDAETALACCGIDVVRLKLLSPSHNYYHPNQAGVLALNPRMPLASFGAVHPAIAKQFDLSAPLLAFEVYVDAAFENKRLTKTAKAALAISNLQNVQRDFAFIVDKDCAAGDVVSAIAAIKIKSATLSDIRIFDIFIGAPLPEDKKSLAVEVTLQPIKQTLTDAEIENIAATIIAAVEKAVGGILRQ